MINYVLAALSSRLPSVLAAPPKPANNTPPGQTVRNLEKILGWASWTVSALCVAGILIVAGRMAIMHRRGEGGEHASGLAWVMTAMILAGSASAIVGAIL